MELTAHLDWEQAVDAFPILAPLADTPQDPRWHAEGDVAIHTRMVWDELHRLDAFQQLNEHDQTLLRWAALFHDAGKAECTKHEEDGSITSAGHAKRSVKLLRHHLWQHPEHWPLDLAAREEVMGLIRWHGAPVYFIHRPSPEDRVAAISQDCRTRLLAILVEADMRGRIITDPKGNQRSGLDTNALFRDAAAELGVLDAPWPFESPHARWKFFQRNARDRGYQAFDDTRFEVILMGGLPGAGKDTWIAKHAPDLPVVSLDDLRQQMDVNPAGNQGKVIQAATAAAREHLRAKRPFIWNATNITESLRRKLIGLFADYGARTRLVWLESDARTLLARNKTRGRKNVPAEVIDRLARKLEFPTPGEVHRLDIVVPVE